MRFVSKFPRIHNSWRIPYATPSLGLAGQLGGHAGLVLVVVCTGRGAEPRCLEGDHYLTPFYYFSGVVCQFDLLQRATSLGFAALSPLALTRASERFPEEGQAEEDEDSPHDQNGDGGFVLQAGNQVIVPIGLATRGGCRHGHRGGCRYG